MKRPCSSRADCCDEPENFAETEREQRHSHKQLDCRQQTLERDCGRWLAAHGLQQPPHGPLPPQFWWALAELNVTLAAFTHTFAEQRLLESHSFTRCPKREAFDKLCFGRGCADAAALQQHPQLQAAGLLLDTALAGCAEAAISQVALKCPPFLQAWAARWMPQAAAAPGGEPPVLRLLVVAGYRAQPGPLRAATVHNLGLPTITSAPAASTVYIPCA